MVGLRQAVLFSVAERYVALALNFIMIATLARLLTPTEFGYSVIGAATIGIVECLRDFGTSGFLVQARVVTLQATRTAFTVMLVLSFAIAAALWTAAGPVADFYERDGLNLYLQITALGLLAGPFASPPLALLRRDMAFRAVAIINVAGALTIALVTVMLALIGASYMSFAWGILAGAFVTAALAVLLYGDVRIFLPCVAEWRAVLSFGGYSSAAGVFAKLNEFVPSLILGRLMDFSAVGLFSRAVMVCQMPDKCLLNGLLPIALPALAVEVRAGRRLAAAYLTGMTYITAVQWSSLLLLIFLAHPAVLILLGEQWVSIVPLVQIISIGLLSSFPTVLAYSVLATAGAIRYAMIGALAGLVIGTVVAAIAAFWGLTVLALGVAGTCVIQAIFSLYLVRLHAPFDPRELFEALRKSAVVAVVCATVPALAIAFNGFDFELSIFQGIAIGGASVAAWVMAVHWTEHPLATEVHLIAQTVANAGRGIGRELRTRVAMVRRSRADT
ncbi:MAG TPA: oligosaccharide flippase family protein [Ancylobacter sp.]